MDAMEFYTHLVKFQEDMNREAKEKEWAKQGKLTEHRTLRDLRK